MERPAHIAALALAALAGPGLAEGRAEGRRQGGRRYRLGVVCGRRLPRGASPAAPWQRPPKPSEQGKGWVKASVSSRCHARPGLPPLSQSPPQASPWASSWASPCAGLRAHAGPAWPSLAHPIRPILNNCSPRLLFYWEGEGREGKGETRGHGEAAAGISRIPESRSPSRRGADAHRRASRWCGSTWDWQPAGSHKILFLSLFFPVKNQQTNE